MRCDLRSALRLQGRALLRSNRPIPARGRIEPPGKWRLRRSRCRGGAGAAGAAAATLNPDASTPYRGGDAPNLRVLDKIVSDDPEKFDVLVVEPSLEEGKWAVVAASRRQSLDATRRRAAHRPFYSAATALSRLDTAAPAARRRHAPPRTVPSRGFSSSPTAGEVVRHCFSGGCKS